MYKYFLLIALILCSFSVSAQWQQTGSKVRYVNGLGIPTKDTAAGVSADSSQILIRPADSSLYVKYKRTWLRVGGGGGSIAGSGTTNYIPKFTSSSAIGNSQIFDNGTKVGIGYGGVGAYKFGVQYTQSSGTLDGFILNANTLTKSYAIWSANAIGGGLYGLSNPYTGFINYTDAAATSYINDGGGYFSWHNSTAELMRLTNSGNVGIGTTSPSSQLEVSGSGGTIITTNSTNASGYSSLLINSSGVLKGYFGFGTYLVTGGGLGIRTASGVPLSFSIGSAIESMFINTSGNVGIGTTSPAAKLSVQGTTLINTNTDNGVDKLQVNGSMNVSTLATTNNLSVTTNATVGGTLRVTGNTTLGTTNTGALTASSLDVSAGSGTFANLYSNGLVQMLGVSVRYRNISATYTATTGDDYFINITSGTFTLNLPTAVTPYAQVYVIKNSGTGTVTLDPFGTQTIDGNTTVTMNVQNQTYTIVGDGSNWKIISKYL